MQVASTVHSVEVKDSTLPLLEEAFDSGLTVDSYKLPIEEIVQKILDYRKRVFNENEVDQRAIFTISSERNRNHLRINMLKKAVWLAYENSQKNKEIDLA